MNSLIAKRCSPIEEAIYQQGFQAGAASRDAEIAELVAAIKFWMKAEGNYDLMKADKMFQEALAKVRKPC